MVYSKIKKILFVLLCLFIVLFPFWCVSGLCAESEDVDYTIVDNLFCSDNTNYFISNSSARVAYFDSDSDYIYTLTNNYNSTYIVIVYTNDTPGVNVPYQVLYTIAPGDSYSFIPNSNYIYTACNIGKTNISFTITKEKISGMNNAVNDLVSNVGIQSLWNTFNDANPFILVVVLFSFGLFIIIALVRKLRKGKGGF